MNLRPWRAKIATLLVLFFLGTFAGQLRDVLDSVRGKIDAGREVTDQVRGAATDAKVAADDAAGLAAELRAQVADLQGKLSAGTATPGQVSQLRALVERLPGSAGRRGIPGPPGPRGASGPPGPPPALSPPASTSTTRGGAPATTRPPTTSTTRPPTTTTTRCAVGLGGLLRVGCS